jgi:hypothetical protein
VHVGVLSTEKEAWREARMAEFCANRDHPMGSAGETNDSNPKYVAYKKLFEIVRDKQDDGLGAFDDSAFAERWVKVREDFLTDDSGGMIGHIAQVTEHAVRESADGGRYKDGPAQKRTKNDA